MAEPSGILIKGGRVVNEDCSVISDVYIKNGKIVEVGPNLQIPAGVQVINATDKLVIPGGIDTHTHMELAFMGTRAVDDFHIGTKVQYVTLDQRNTFRTVLKGCCFLKALISEVT